MLTSAATCLAQYRTPLMLVAVLPLRATSHTAHATHLQPKKGAAVKMACKTTFSWNPKSHTSASRHASSQGTACNAIAQAMTTYGGQCHNTSQGTNMLWYDSSPT